MLGGAREDMEGPEHVCLTRGTEKVKRRGERRRIGYEGEVVVEWPDAKSEKGIYEEETFVK